MGDRGNIVVRHEGMPDIFLYSHWTGSDLPGVLKHALAKKWRWDDKAYLTRVIFCEMIRGSEDQETGFGIDTQQPDNSHPLVVCDVTKQRVYFEDVGEGEVSKKSAKGWTFEQYVKSGPEEHGS